MEIKSLTAAQLKQFIFSEEYETMPDIPISRHRALSQINNPRVSGSDVLLLLAYEKNNLLGYLGMLPDKIFLNEKEIKATWLSCLWIHPDARGRGAAKKLLEKSFEVSDGKILATEFTPDAQKLYDDSEKFNDLKISKGVRGYLRFNLYELLPKKFSVLRNFILPLKAFDFLFNIFNSVRLLFFRYKITEHEIIFVNEIDEQIGMFIGKHNQKNFFQREKEELNWINKFPWIIPASAHDQFSRRYHFSYWEKRFEFLNVVLYDKKNNVTGYMMLSIRGNNLQVPYFYCEKVSVSDAAKFIFNLMLDKKLNMITVFHSELAEYIQRNPSPFFLKRKMKRHYLISKNFADEMKSVNEIEFQDGDGDCAFT